MTTSAHLGSLTHLQAGGVSVVLDSRDAGLPAVLHWGRDVGKLSDAELTELGRAWKAPAGDSVIDVPERTSILPTPAEGWVGTPGLIGSRAGADFSALFVVVDEAAIPVNRTVADGRIYRAVDEVAGLGLSIEVALAPTGLLSVRATLTNIDTSSGFDLSSLTLALPVPSEADELFDLTGRHARERVPQRGPFRVGSLVRESRKGKPGLDASYLLAAGVPGFGFGAGEVWGLHVGWSGNQLAYAERAYNGLRHLGGGELLLSGEIRLAPGESYSGPWLYASYGDGFNQLAQRFHGYLRARDCHPTITAPGGHQYLGGSVFRSGPGPTDCARRGRRSRWRRTVRAG